MAVRTCPGCLVDCQRCGKALMPVPIDDQNLRYRVKNLLLKWRPETAPVDAGDLADKIISEVSEGWVR